VTTSTQWQLARDAAERYERILVPAILGPATRALVAWSDLRNGEAVLDVGCGTGAAARLAAEIVGASGRVVGVDINAGMIDVATSLAPVQGATIEWLQNSAYQLLFMEGEFDVAFCAQTLQFLDNRPLALAEMYRTLKFGGRIAVSSWCNIQENPYFHELVQAVTTHISPETAAELGAAFNLSDSNTIHTLLTEAGFKNVTTTVRQLDLELPQLQDFVPRHVSATPMSTGFQAASEAARRAVIQSMSGQLAQYKTYSGIRVPFCTHLVQAIK
jgi:ubiquinone/menaquinone biosynthesis C-methylase UbiE